VRVMIRTTGPFSTIDSCLDSQSFVWVCLCVFVCVCVCYTHVNILKCVLVYRYRYILICTHAHSSDVPLQRCKHTHTHTNAHIHTHTHTHAHTHTHTHTHTQTHTHAHTHTWCLKTLVPHCERRNPVSLHHTLALKVAGPIGPSHGSHGTGLRCESVYLSHFSLPNLPINTVEIL